MTEKSLLDLLSEELRYEDRVTRYLTVFRAGRTPVVFPNTCRERRAFEQAKVDFQEEVKHMVTTNGERL